MEAAGSERISESLTWQAACRSDARVGELLLGGEEPDGIYGIASARIVDHFLLYIEELGVGAAVRGLRPRGVQREVVPAELYVVLYFLRCLARIPSQESLPDLLFADTALMLRVGFNAHQVEFGITRRGEHAREGIRRNAPVDPEAISKNVAKLDAKDVRAFVTSTFKALWAKHPVVSAKGLFVIDGTCIEPGETTTGAGVTSRTKSVRTTEGVKTVSELTTGFKMVWMWSVETGLPVAICFGTAEVDERPFVMPLIEQARAVLGDRCEIGTVLIDRGFLNGQDLWALDRAGIRFVIPARHDLNAYEEAARAVANDVPTHKLHRQSRTATASVRPEGGKGKLITKQQTTEAVGVEGLRSFTTYRAAESMGGRRPKGFYRKEFVANPINAVVLTREDGRKSFDLTLLTNGPVTRPLATLDDYDERSKIENQGHRVLKQDWHLERPAQRTAKMTEIHMCFVMAAYALTQGYRAWLDAQVRLEDEGLPQTLGEHVRRIEAENRDKLIVFCGDAYGIFYTSEFSMLLGRRVKNPNPKGAANIDELMARLRAPPPRA